MHTLVQLTERCPSGLMPPCPLRACSPADLFGVAVVVLLLGIRHGFDADHVAAIDGMTCHNSKDRAALARCCGVLFSGTASWW